MARTSLTQRIEQALSRPGEEISRWLAFLRFHIELWRFCGKRLHENNLLAMSAALSFRTIFAMIPLLVLSFLMLRSIGVVEDGKLALRQVLERSGLAQILVEEKPALEGDSPAKEPEATPEAEAADIRRINLADQIVALVEDVESKLTFQRIGPVGAAVLIWTALTLFMTLEASLNRIFEAHRSRSLSRRIVLFWTAMTLGPIAVGVALFVSNQSVRAATGMPVLSWFTQVLGWIVPVLVGILVVAMLYMLVPNTHVKYTSALTGALISVPLWLVARWLFALYVDRFVMKGNLYGVLGLLPLFLLWLNVSWSVFLFGGQLAYTATNLKRMRMEDRAEQMTIGPSDLLAVLLAVARPYAEGQGPPEFATIASASGVTDEAASRIVELLSDAEIICATHTDEEPRYLLTRPPSRINLAEVIAMADPPPILGDNTAGNGAQRAIHQVRSCLQEAMGRQTLADLIDTTSDPGAQQATAPERVVPQPPG